MHNTMARETWVWSCCWCRDPRGNYRSLGMTVEILSCPECAHVRCESCYVQWVKIHSPTLPPSRRGTASPQSGSNLESRGSGRVRGTGEGDNSIFDEQLEVLERMLDPTAHTTPSQFTQIPDPAESSSDFVFQGTATSRLQELGLGVVESGLEVVDAGQKDMRSIDPRPENKNIKTETMEVETGFNAQPESRYIHSHRDFTNQQTDTTCASSLTSANATEFSGPLERPKLLFQITHPIGNNEVENKQASPLELFVTNPASYSEEITVLHHKILQLGQNTFENIEQDYMAKRHVIPFRKLDVELEPSIPFSLSFEQRAKINGYIQVQILASTETLSSILGGTQLLQNEGFSNSSSYNIIVADIDRPNVLNIRPVSIPILNLLLKLLHEVNSCNQQRDMVLKDVAELLSHIVVSLGLGIPPIAVVADEHNLKRQQDICHLLSSVLAVLHVALMSFVRSHLDISGYTPSGSLSDGLHIESPGGTLFLGSRRLKCLNGLLKQPVWAFSFIPKNSKNLKVDYDGFYISSSIDDLVELWGPFRLNYAKDTKRAILNSIETRGGRFIAIGSGDSQVQPLNDETPCHWSTWLDIPRDQQRVEEVEAIDTTKRLLVGTHSSDESGSRLGGAGRQGQKRRRRPKLEMLERCMCKERYASKYGEFDLSTRAPSWKLDARTFQASGGQYFTVTMGFTYKFDAGWTLKDAILESWIDAGKDDSSHIPNPHYMDYLVVLDISHCSGHARRISLWKLLQYSDLRVYFRRNLEMGICQEIESVLLQHYSDDCFATIWPTLDTNKRNVLTLAFKFVLKTLRCTGVGQDGLLQVWDITTIPRIDGRRIDPRWSTLVQDDIGCATFAIITGACKTYKPRVRALEKPPAGLQILYTKVCITADQELNQRDASINERVIPPHLESSSSPSFSSRWGVPRSNSKDTKLEKFSDMAQVNAEEKLLESIRMRQKAREMTSGDAKSNDSIRQSVSPGSIRPRITPTNGNTNIYDDTRPRSSNGTLQSRAKGKRKPEAFICETSLSFRNGRGQKVGKLILEPLEGPEKYVDLNSFSETSSLPATWQSSSSSLIDTIYEKGVQIDKNVSSWAQRSTGLIPRLIGRVALEEKSNPPFVTEYIRPGDQTAYQRVLMLYIC
ncbi:hypothetical protein OCU04_009744 [Sclerotinia nivalis]|uniref:Uncharacterized protein n=1 Tax=Sclerotinia nivalis TaxID=352851 RepID=A0A9X0AFZ6_9HELO|nr:hypothetical protein OCU04_009744 [Sclerotinia nivalis]